MPRRLLVLTLTLACSRPADLTECTDQSTGLTQQEGERCSCLNGIGTVRCERWVFGSTRVACIDCVEFSCVGAGTRVSTPEGPQPVETLALGDLVLAVDPATGVTEAAPVTGLRTAWREAFALDVGRERLVMTADHPVFDPLTRTFVPAGAWQSGERSQVLSIGPDAVSMVHATNSAPVGVVQVFDLTVAHRWHTFVANGVLVHNKSPPRCADNTGRALVPDSPCTCDGGTGFIDCEVLTFPAACTRCGLQVDGGRLLDDAGQRDGGP